MDVSLMLQEVLSDYAREFAQTEPAILSRIQEMGGDSYVLSGIDVIRHERESSFEIWFAVMMLFQGRVPPLAEGTLRIGGDKLYAEVTGRVVCMNSDSKWAVEMYAISGVKTNRYQGMDADLARVTALF